MSFDEAVLADVELLTQRDDGRLLWALAAAGAQVRRAVALGEEFGVQRLAGGERPRAVLLVGDVPAEGALRILARLLAPTAPTVVWSGADLPRWAGPNDALLLGCLDGWHPRLVGITEQATRRGLLTAIAAPADTPIASAAGRAPLAILDAAVHPRAALWAILTPLLQAVHVLELHALSLGEFAEIADALDVVAETCRPSGEAFTNPAKALAVDLADALPLVVGAGPLAGIAARLVADNLRLYAGAPAISITLPDGVATAGALLVSAPGDGDFFRDRTEGQHARLVIVGGDGDPADPVFGDRSDAQLQLDEVAARRAASALREIASENGIGASAVELPVGPPLTRLAAAVAFGSFTAAYLALASGINPSAPRAGELAR